MTCRIGSLGRDSQLRKMNKVFEKITDPFGNKRGDRNERRALLAALKLYRSRNLPITRKPYLAGNNSSYDSRGYDLLIPTDRGVIPIQIKSSEFGRRKFMRTHCRIPCIVMPKAKCLVITRDLVSEALMQGYEDWRRCALR